MPWYDDETLLLPHLFTLTAFHRLVRERQAAGYTRKEVLTEYIVLGCYQLDTCGNCSRITSDDGAKLGDDLPPVLTRKAFWALQPPGASIQCRLSGRSYAAPEQRCAVCGQAWTMKNAHDIQTESDVQTYPLAMFKGWTLDKCIQHFEARTDAEYSREREHLLRSDRFIDRAPKYPGAEEDWKKREVKNEHGTLSESETSPVYVVQGDESLSFFVLHAKHAACAAYERENAALYFARVTFERGGLAGPLKSIPNGYMVHEKSPPWVEVATALGTFTLGRCKRVWEVRYPCDVDALPEWPHTSGAGYFHAWSEDDILNGLKQLREHPFFAKENP